MRIEKLNSSYFVFADNNKEIGSFQLDVDGSYYFWDNSELTGCWTAQNLKEIARLLDEVNKPFDDQVKEYFDQEKKDFEGQARVEYRKLLNESGMFWEFYPQLSGEYKKDKEEWLIEYQKLEDLRNNAETNF